MKRKQSRAPPLVYDPDAHREYVTGFRRRKEARRLEAKSKAVEAEKEARRQRRKEKREVIRSAVHTLPDSDEEDENPLDVVQERQIVTYQADDLSVTTVVAPLKTESATRVRWADRVNGNAAEKEDVKVSKDAKATKIAKPRGKRRVSYTHSMSKGNKRKSQLKARREKSMLLAR